MYIFVVDQTAIWQKLKLHASEDIAGCHLRDLMKDSERCSQLTASTDNLVMDFSRQSVQPKTMDMLFELANEADLTGKMQKMSQGVHINSTEDRSVLHFALRAPKGVSVIADCVDVAKDVHAVQRQVANFSAAVRTGAWKGCTGKPITSVVSIGIGGSYLGPEFVFEALRNDAGGAAQSVGRTLRFLANVDPVDVNRALAGLDPETTLVCIVSKTFTTAETMMNARTVQSWLVRKLESQRPRAEIVRQHMVAVSTAVDKATAFGIDPANIFAFWDWVGGRYSVCSAVGVLPLALHYGFDIIAEFLAGCAAMDKHFFETPLRSNVPVLLGLLGVWNASILGRPTRAILPYSQGLVRFAAHAQQLEMESNGKHVTVDGTPTPFSTGEVIFGEPGTNGQHSFYQLIHQSTEVIPCEFIGFVQSQTPINHVSFNSTKVTEVVPNHDELMSNFFAQPDALAYGKTVEELETEGVRPELRSHKQFAGNRPSTSLLFSKLTPFTCGQLLALYEHRVAVQGFLWDINSFDQWGVELGKVLAVRVRGTLVAANQQVVDAAVSAVSGEGATLNRVDVSKLDLGGYNTSTQSLLTHYLQNKF